MPLIATSAIVLQAFPYSETSKILRLLTPSHGVFSVIAKGAQRPRSRFGGLLEPFTEGEAQVFFKEGRDLHTLAGFDLVRSRQRLGRDLVAFAGASLVAELVLRSGTTEAQPALFDVLSSALGRITDAGIEQLEREVVGNVWHLVSLLGYRPQTEACVTCGVEPLPDEQVRFDVEGGGIACVRCRPVGRPVGATTRQELRAMVDGSALPEPVADPAVHRALLRAFLNAHLARQHPIRSLDLFLQQLE